MRSGLLLLIVLNILSCAEFPSSTQMESWKIEIIDTEKAFAEMVAAEGIHAAFVTFAADDAVLMRGNQLIRNKKGIDKFYEGNTIKTLSWAPEYVDIAASGDLAYTYGPFTFISVDSSGNRTENKGIFHTVWKKQADGSWKYVWD